MDKLHLYSAALPPFEIYSYIIKGSAASGRSMNSHFFGTSYAPRGGESTPDEIEGILARLPLRYFPQLSGTLLHFIESVGRVDLYEGIKFDSEARLGEEKMKDFVKKMIANHQGKPEYRGSNVITKYVALYYVLQDAVKLLNQYEMQLAKALKSERL
jgi:hypothetical protein